MMKHILNLLKKIVFAVFIIYGYNLLAAPINLIIPINIITVSLIAVLGFPALFSLIAIMIIIF